jgi:hypothetical protein
MDLAQRPSQPTWPTGPLGLGSGSVKPTQSTRLALTLPLSRSRASLWRTLVASPPPGDSGRLRRVLPPRPWASCSPSRPLSTPPSGFAGRLLSEEIGLDPAREIALWRHWTRHLAGCFLVPTVLHRGNHGVCVHAGGVVLSVVPWWSLPLVASDRLRGHCPAMPSRQAPGRRWVCRPSSLPHSLLSGHGLWPSGQDQWAKLTGWFCAAV